MYSILSLLYHGFLGLCLADYCHREDMENMWNSLSPETLPGPDSD